MQHSLIDALDLRFLRLLDEIDYQANRIPLEGVPLDVSGEELVGCDCTDGCRDRTKCACWLKTFEVGGFVLLVAARDHMRRVVFRI